VLFEPKTRDGPVRASPLQQIRRPFKEAGAGWIDQEVFIHETPSSAPVIDWLDGSCVFSGQAPLQNASRKRRRPDTGTTEDSATAIQRHRCHRIAVSQAG
jgi:hypothetical protein